MRIRALCLLTGVLLLAGCGETVQETLPPETQSITQSSEEYITVNGKEKVLADSVRLIAGYTRDKVVQFKHFYDFGLWDERPIGFSGSVWLDGEMLDSSEYCFYGYADNDTIAMKLTRGKQLTGSTLKIEAGSVIFYDDEAVSVQETFEAVWDGEAWTESRQ